MISLVIDASTYDGSACVIRGREVLSVRTVRMRGATHEQLMPAVAGVIQDAELTPQSVRRIVCGAGPGSFTSLRIAASIAKGLATALHAPLYAVSSLALMVASVEPPLAAGEYLAVLDALRGEHYVATCDVDASGDVVDVGPVRLVDSHDIDALRRSGTMLVGADETRGAAPHARGGARAMALVERAGEVDVERWEPEYGRVAEAQRRWEAAHARELRGA